MVHLYNKKDTITVVGGILFLHIMVTLLCCFFVKKFLIQTYEPGVYLLLLFLISMVVIVDVLLYRIQTFRRYLVTCKFDADGIHCSLLGFKKWTIKWSDIRIVGITGYSTTGMGILFFSTDQNEKYSIKKCIEISDRRIVFEINEKNWCAIKVYLPNPMKERLWESIQKRQDFFYRIGTRI